MKFESIVSETAANETQNFFNLNFPIVALVILLLILFCLAGFFASALTPNKRNIERIIDKFKGKDYALPYVIAERYAVWYGSRTVMFFVTYFIDIMSIILTLTTVYFASIGNFLKNIFIVFSMVSMIFTIFSIYFSPVKNSVSLSAYLARTRRRNKKGLQ